MVMNPDFILYFYCIQAKSADLVKKFKDKVAADKRVMAVQLNIGDSYTLVTKL